MKYEIFTFKRIRKIDVYLNAIGCNHSSNNSTIFSNNLDETVIIY